MDIDIKTMSYKSFMRMFNPPSIDSRKLEKYRLATLDEINIVRSIDKELTPYANYVISCKHLNRYRCVIDIENNNYTILEERPSDDDHLFLIKDNECMDLDLSILKKGERFISNSGKEEEIMSISKSGIWNNSILVTCKRISDGFVHDMTLDYLIDCKKVIDESKINIGDIFKAPRGSIFKVLRIYEDNGIRKMLVSLIKYTVENIFEKTTLTTATIGDENITKYCIKYNIRKDNHIQSGDILKNGIGEHAYLVLDINQRENRVNVLTISNKEETFIRFDSIWAFYVLSIN